MTDPGPFVFDPEPPGPAPRPSPAPAPPTPAPPPATGTSFLAVYWLRVPVPYLRVGGGNTFLSLATIAMLAWVLLTHPNHGPSPEPGPTPPPSPAPVVAGKLTLTLVYSAARPDRNAAEMLAQEGAKVQAQEQALNFRWMAFEENRPELAATNLKAYADKYGTPVVLVQAQGQGKPLEPIKPPLSAEAVLARIKALRGQK